MKYSAQISFNASDYVPIQSKIKMKGEWVEGTMIWREKIKDLKINKDDDWNTFVTLESWFSDSTKFETKIYVKILENTNGLDSELLTGWTNGPGATAFDTAFTTSGKDITSAIHAATSTHYCYSNDFNLTAGESVRISINLTLNSGTAPSLRVQRFDGAVTYRAYTLVNGSQELTFNPTVTQQYQLTIISGVAQDISAVCSSKEIITVSTQESLHWFGIKWGEIDQDNTFYEVNPELQDLYSIWLMPYLNDNTDLAYDNTVVMSLMNQGSTYYPLVYNLSDAEPFCELLEVFLKHKINEITAWPEADVVSSILFGSAYEDASTVTVTNGLLIDYVTSGYNVFKYAVVALDNQTFRDFTLKTVFELLALFQIYPYFDSNDKLRLEHISFFKDKLENNDVPITLQNYDNKFNYIISDIITREELEMMLSDELKTYGLSVYTDWQKLPMIYSRVRNREDLQVKTYSFTKFYTNLDFYYKQSALVNTYCMIAAGYANYAMNWVNIDMDTFVATDHVLSIVYNLVGRTCASKNFASIALVHVTVVGTVTGEFTISVWDRSGNIINSDTLTVNTTGTTTGDLTVITPSDDMFLKIDVTVDGAFDGYIIATGDDKYMNPWAIGAKSTTSVMNGHFSKANILDSYWKDYRASLSGEMNGTIQAFTSTKWNLLRKTVKQHFTDLPNPLYGLNDGTRIARIKSWERDLDSGYIDLDLTYQEDT